MGGGWTEKEAAHLLSRTTFYAGIQEVNASVDLGKEETVRRLLEGEPLTGEPKELLPLEQVKADGKELAADQIVDQQTYWLYRMVNTDSPLVEKMTLFWHGHFATSYQKVREIPLMLRQNELFRKQALGSFRDLVEQVTKDPAMMLYLDTNNNRKGKPNENYAREVMELFTLGIGHYTEQDIREAARALTGWSYDKKTDEVKFNPKQHDNGIKSFLGESGPLDEKNVIAILFKQEALPRFIAKKLLVYFAADNPTDDWVDKLAAVFAKNFNIRETLSFLFLSDDFYAEASQGALIKTPAEYVAGLVKAFDLPLAKGFVQAMRKMGQELYLPPDVAGWRGGTAWLSSSSLLARYQFAESVAKRLSNDILNKPEFRPESQAEADGWVQRFGNIVGIRNFGDQSKRVLSQYAEDTFLHAGQKTGGMRGLLQLVMISPEAQMK